MLFKKRAVKWIHGCRYDHYSESVYYAKQKELEILPIKFKFVLNDLILFYKIIKSLVSVKLPDHFTFLETNLAKCTREKSILINKIVKVDKTETDKIAVIDPTIITCSIRPNCDSYKNCYVVKRPFIYITFS